MRTGCHDNFRLRLRFSSLFTNLTPCPGCRCVAKSRSRGRSVLRIMACGSQPHFENRLPRPCSLTVLSDYYLFLTNLKPCPVCLKRLYLDEHRLPRQISFSYVFLALTNRKPCRGCRCVAKSRSMDLKRLYLDAHPLPRPFSFTLLSYVYRGYSKLRTHTALGPYGISMPRSI